MGKLNQGILGSARGKIGNVVGAKWKDLNTVRAYQPQVHNPKTIGQVKNRNIFTTTVGLCKQVLPYINEAYGSVGNMSPYNKAVSYNCKNAFITTGATPTIDHTKVSFCEYDGSSVSNVALTGMIGQVMKLTWSANTTVTEELSSLVSVIFVNCRTNKVVCYKDTIARSASTVSLTVPLIWTGDTVAAHFVTSDYSQMVNNKPKKIIKFKAGADLSSKVK